MFTRASSPGGQFCCWFKFDQLRNQQQQKDPACPFSWQLQYELCTFHTCSKVTWNMWYHLSWFSKVTDRASTSGRRKISAVTEREGHQSNSSIRIRYNNTANLSAVSVQSRKGGKKKERYRTTKLVKIKDQHIIMLAAAKPNYTQSLSRHGMGCSCSGDCQSPSSSSFSPFIFYGAAASHWSNTHIQQQQCLQVTAEPEEGSPHVHSEHSQP